MLPLIVPVTVKPEEIIALPSVSVFPEKVKLPPNVWFTANKFSKTPLRPCIVLPVIVAPLKF